MHYKTIALELLESHPALYNRLRLSRTLLREVERYATDLRTEHLRLSEMMDPSAAMEMAIQALKKRIKQAYPFKPHPPRRGLFHPAKSQSPATPPPRPPRPPRSSTAAHPPRRQSVTPSP